jgi:TonB family protein
VIVDRLFARLSVHEVRAMLGTLNSRRKTLETVERRGRVRSLVTPPIYVNLNGGNGGLVFNISEDGLALTAAMELADGGFLSLRILLPGSEGWIEANGEIAWRGNSKKEAGVRFIGLAEEARRRISSWIAAEASRGEFQEAKDAGAGFVGMAEDTRQKIKNWSASETPAEELQSEKERSAQLRQGQKQDVRQRLKDWIFQEAPRTESSLAKSEPLGKAKRIVEIASVRAFESLIPESANHGLMEEKQGAIISANSDARLGGTTPDLAKLNVLRAPLTSGKMRRARGAQDVVERRAEARTLIAPPVYVNLENTNGGLAFNMSQDGMALTAALGLAGNHTMHLRVEMPDSQGPIELKGQLAWTTESGKTAGIKFIGVTEDSRQRIRDWLAAEASGGSLRSEKRILSASGHHSPDDVPTEAPMVPRPEILSANSAVEKRMLEAILSGDHSASADPPSKVSTPEQEPQRELQKETFVFPRSPAEQAETLENSKPNVSDSRDVHSGGAVQEDSPTSATSHLAAPERRGIRPKSKPAFHPIASGTRNGKLRRLAAVATLAGATAAGIGWIAAKPALRNELATFASQSTEGTSKPAELETPLPSNKISNDRNVRPENSRPQTLKSDPLPAQGRATDVETHTTPTHPPAHDIEPPAAKSTVKGLVHRTESSWIKSQPTKVPERAVVAASIPSVESTRNQIVESSPAPTIESSPAPAKSPSASIASGAMSDVKEKAGPPSVPDQPAAAAAPTWSVAVSADPYPSIRMPQDKKSQKAPSTSLQIGRVISRVDPIYPEDAKQQGIEGAVRLHVVVGRDGSVQNVEPTSGPNLLAKAAVSAVREWRYAQTLLGGQPVETEQDIVVKFRVAGPSASKN